MDIGERFKRDTMGMWLNRARGEMLSLFFYKQQHYQRACAIVQKKEFSFRQLPEECRRYAHILHSILI